MKIKFRSAGPYLCTGKRNYWQIPITCGLYPHSWFPRYKTSPFRNVVPSPLPLMVRLQIFPRSRWDVKDRTSRRSLIYGNVHVEYDESHNFGTFPRFPLAKNPNLGLIGLFFGFCGEIKYPVDWAPIGPCTVEIDRYHDRFMFSCLSEQRSTVWWCQTWLPAKISETTGISGFRQGLNSNHLLLVETLCFHVDQEFPPTLFISDTLIWLATASPNWAAWR